MPTGAPRRWGSSAGTTRSGLSSPGATHRVRPEDGQPVDTLRGASVGTPHEVPAADRADRLGPGEPRADALPQPDRRCGRRSAAGSADRTAPSPAAAAARARARTASARSWRTRRGPRRHPWSPGTRPDRAAGAPPGANRPSSRCGRGGRPRRRRRSPHADGDPQGPDPAQEQDVAADERARPVVDRAQDLGWGEVVAADQGAGHRPRASGGRRVLGLLPDHVSVVEHLPPWPGHPSTVPAAAPANPAAPARSVRSGHDPAPPNLGPRSPRPEPVYTCVPCKGITTAEGRAG